MSRNKVANEDENAHHDLLSNRLDVGSGNLEDLNSVLNSCVEIDVVGSDTSSDTDLELLGLNRNGVRINSNNPTPEILTFSMSSRVR